MHENDYTFVTIDNSSEAVDLGDVVVVDVYGDDGILDAVMLDDGETDTTDFITLSDDTVVMSDVDVVDNYSIDIDGMDISFMI